MPSARAVIRILLLLIVDLPAIASLLIARLPAMAVLVTREPYLNDACGALRRQPRDLNRRRAGNRRHHGTSGSDEKQTRCIFHMGLIEPISVNPESQINCRSVAAISSAIALAAMPEASVRQPASCEPPGSSARSDRRDCLAFSDRRPRFVRPRIPQRAQAELPPR